MDTAIAMAKHLLDVAEIDFDNCGRVRQAVVGTFVFGMVNAYGMSARHTPQEIAEVAIQVFENVLHYTPEAAGEGVQQCIEATRPSGHETMNAIMHRGIDGHRQYLASDSIGLKENINGVLARF